MAKVISTALRLTAGAIVGAALGVSTYRAGKQAGREEAFVKGPEGHEDTLRPDTTTQTRVSAPIGRNPEAYHALLNDRASALRSRIAEQVYASRVGDGGLTSTQQLQAYGVDETGGSSAQGRVSSSGNSSGQEDWFDSDQSAEPNPYERIQDALRTSNFFDEQGDQEFTMP